jgi:hypothetical protein
MTLWHKGRNRAPWPDWYEASLSHQVIEVIREIPHRMQQEFPKSGPNKNIPFLWTFTAGDSFLAEFRWSRVGADAKVTVTAEIAERMKCRFQL